MPTKLVASELPLVAILGTNVPVEPVLLEPELLEPEPESELLELLPCEQPPRVGVASVPLSVSTVTVVPVVMLVGKFDGKGSWVELGLLDRTRVPAPLASVLIWPTTVPPVPPIVTSKALLAAAPVTLTLKTLSTRRPRCWSCR